MPIAVVTEELKSLNEYYLQEVFNYITYLKFKQESQQEDSFYSNKNMEALMHSKAQMENGQHSIHELVNDK